MCFDVRMRVGCVYIILIWIIAKEFTKWNKQNRFELSPDPISR